MKLERNSSANIKKGASVKTYLDAKDAQIKSMKSTTAGVAEGALTFPSKKTDWEISVKTWIGRDGNSREYPCIICKDANNEEHEIALSAFRAKDEIVTNDMTIQCPNICEFDADYNTIWNTLQSAKEIVLHRVVGRRNGRKGRYEFFTMK